MRLKKQVAAAETTMKNYQSEVDKLNHIISEADAERFRQQREYDVVINERDILGTQVPASRVAIKIERPHTCTSLIFAELLCGLVCNACLLPFS